MNCVRVVHVRKASFDHYIGRAWAEFSASPYGNPFHAHEGIAILKFAEWWYAPEQKRLREKALTEIKEGDTIGCWCKPRSYHGDIIAGYLNWKRQEKTLYG